MRIARFALPAALVALLLAGCGPANDGRDILFQTSTMGALFAGVYDGDVTIKELRSHGDFGLGTFNALDGEMTILDGKAYAPDQSMQTPFAAVKFFQGEIRVSTVKTFDLAPLQEWIDIHLPARNMPYAIKIEGMFYRVKVRSVPRQEKPYRRLVDIIADQPTFEFRSVRGTMVCFRLPSYVTGTNVPGYHFHFLTADRSAGGHVLECRVGEVKLEAGRAAAIHLAIPANESFQNADLDLSGEQAGEVQKVEKD